jgi:hypothetical protein
MNFLSPEKQLLSEFNNDSGQVVFKEAIPDLYSKVTKHCYFFNGCRIHQHLDPKCPFNTGANELTIGMFGQTFKECNELFFKKMENLLLNNSDQINEIIIEWECNYLERKKNPNIKSFLELQFKPHPLYRLSARCACRGGFSENFALKWQESEFKNQKFIYIDTVGLYSYVAMQFKFMTGKYFYVLGQDIQKIKIINNQFFYEDKKVTGSILLTILPPPSLFFPFLLYRRKKDLKTFNTLCQLCCENENTNCNHNETQRALTSTYMISEIEYALVLGYKIIAIHECILHFESSYILRDFVQKLNFFKTKYSNCLSHCKNLREKTTYCEKLNQSMQFNDVLKLTPTNIENNPPKRTFYKLASNALFGKLSERHDKSQIIFAQTNSEIEKIFSSGKQIENVFCINDSICELHVKKPHDSKLPPNRKSNCLLGAQITAFARQIIHQHAMKLIQLNYNLFQINTDSLLYSQPISHKIPFELSHAVGDFKIEINGQILSYYSLGTKSYSITYRNPSNDVETISKICGLTIKGKGTQKLLNADLFDFYLNQSVVNIPKNMKIPQKRFKKNFQNFSVKPLECNIKFSNTLSTRRIINLLDPILKTYPFGYVPDQP